MSVNSFEIYKFKAKTSKIYASPLCLDNFSKDFSVDNMKKRLAYMDMCMIFQPITTILMLMIFYIFTNI